MKASFSVLGEEKTKMRKRRLYVAAVLAAMAIAGCNAKASVPETIPETAPVETIEVTTKAALETTAEETAETVETSETADPSAEETETPPKSAESAAEAETVDEAEKEDPTDMKKNLPGGWTEQVSEITDKIREIFEKAYPDDGNTYYDPIALLGTQVVAGTNYKILFRTGTVGATTPETYAIGKIYADLQGNVEVISTKKTGVKTHFDDEDWQIYTGIHLTDDERNAFQNAFAGMTGVSYEPIFVIAENDTGYMVLYKAAVVYPNAKPYYAVVKIDKTEKGNLDIGEISDLTKE